MRASPPPEPGGTTSGAPAEAGPRHGALWHLVVGFLMGTADLIPGVSGGTVALAAGVYSRLVAAIREATEVAGAALRGRPGEALRRLRKLDWALLLPLLGGILTAVLSLASLVARLLESTPIHIGGLFLGLVLGSAVVAFGMLHRASAGAVAILAVSAAATFVVLGLVPTAHAAGETRDVALWAYGASGALAICAMILPGVSGSFMLVAVGMYDNVLGAVNDRAILPVLVFVAGCALGLAAFSRLLFWLIRHHHDRLVAAMIGLMVGSVRILWPWPGGPVTSELAAPSGPVLGPALLAGVGFVAVLAVARLGKVGEENPISAGEGTGP